MAGETLFAALGYMMCSSLMLVVNKVAVHLLQAPMFVLLAQLFVSAAAVWAIGLLGLIKVDPLEWPKVKKFVGVSTMFLLTIFTNMKTLQVCIGMQPMLLLRRRGDFGPFCPARKRGDFHGLQV